MASLQIKSQNSVFSLTEEISRKVVSESEAARLRRNVDQRCDAALRFPCLNICVRGGHGIGGPLGWQGVSKVRTPWV